MKKTISLILLSLFSSTLLAKQHNRIDYIGSSKAGQFLAIEEYGYEPNEHVYFVNIRVLNVWTKQYVGPKIEVMEKASRPFLLERARSKARQLSVETFQKYNINRI